MTTVALAADGFRTWPPSEDFAAARSATPPMHVRLQKRNTTVQLPCNWRRSTKWLLAVSKKAFAAAIMPSTANCRA